MNITTQKKVKVSKLEKKDMFSKKLNMAPSLPNPNGNRKKRRESKQRIK